MQSKLSNTAIAFGVFAAIYSAIFGLLFGFFLNLIVVIIEAAAKTDGTWTGIFMFGGIAVMFLGIVNIVGCIFAKRKPMVAGIIFSVTGGIYLLYGALVLIKLFAPAFLGLIAVGLVFYVIAIATAFAAATRANKEAVAQVQRLVEGDAESVQEEQNPFAE